MAALKRGNKILLISFLFPFIFHFLMRCLAFPTVLVKSLSSLTAEPEQSSTEATHFIACSGAGYQLMRVPDVRLPSASALSGICKGNHVYASFIWLIFYHISRKRIDKNPRTATKSSNLCCRMCKVCMENGASHCQGTIGFLLGM